MNLQCQTSEVPRLWPTAVPFQKDLFSQLYPRPSGLDCRWAIEPPQCCTYRQVYAFFWGGVGIPSSDQSLFLALLRGPYGILGIELGSAKCKAFLLYYGFGPETCLWFYSSCHEICLCLHILHTYVSIPLGVLDYINVFTTNN